MDQQAVAAVGAPASDLHVGRLTSGGFQVVEVWDSEEQRDRFNAEVVGPAIAQLSGGQPPGTEPAREESEPHGLIVPSAAVVR
jgi:hypothetical protein